MDCELLGGQPELAQELARKIVHQRDNVMEAIDEQGEALNNVKWQGRIEGIAEGS